MVFKSLFTFLLTLSLHANPISVKIFKGKEVVPYESMIKEHRQKEFKEYPYLMWNGDESEEFTAAFYSKEPFGAIAIAFEEENIVGFITGTSLDFFDSGLATFGCDQITDHLNSLLVPKKNYYFADMIVFEKYRGRQIVDHLFTALETFAVAKGFNSISFVSIDRKNHLSQKPLNYKSPESIWKRLNCQPSDQTIIYQWPTVQEDSTLIEEDNPCDIWIKYL